MWKNISIDRINYFLSIMGCISIQTSQNQTIAIGYHCFQSFTTKYDQTVPLFGKQSDNSCNFSYIYLCIILVGRIWSISSWNEDLLMKFGISHLFWNNSLWIKTFTQNLVHAYDTSSMIVISFFFIIFKNLFFHWSWVCL